VLSEICRHRDNASGTNRARIVNRGCDSRRSLNAGSLLFEQPGRNGIEAAYGYRNGGMFDLRPLYMFYKPAILNGTGVPRFTKIEDPEVIAQLEAIKARM